MNDNHSLIYLPPLVSVPLSLSLCSAHLRQIASSVNLLNLLSSIRQCGWCTSSACTCISRTFGFRLYLFYQKGAIYWRALNQVGRWARFWCWITLPSSVVSATIRAAASACPHSNSFLPKMQNRTHTARHSHPFQPQSHSNWRTTAVRRKPNYAHAELLWPDDWMTHFLNKLSNFFYLFVLFIARRAQPLNGGGEDGAQHHALAIQQISSQFFPFFVWKTFQISSICPNISSIEFPSLCLSRTPLLFW